MTDRSPPMKPEMIEAAAEAIYNLFTYDEPGEKPTWVERGNSFKQEDARRYAAAALSVPAAAVVGEPEGWTLVPIVPTQKMIDAGKQWTKPSYIYDAMLEAAPSAPDGWRPIETAPKDGREILAYGYARCDGSRYANGQHIAWWDAELGWTGRDPDDRVTLHPSHWQPLPIPPANGDSHE